MEGQPNASYTEYVAVGSGPPAPDYANCEAIAIDAVTAVTNVEDIITDAEIVAITSTVLCHVEQGENPVAAIPSAGVSLGHGLIPASVKVPVRKKAGHKLSFIANAGTGVVYVEKIA